MIDYTVPVVASVTYPETVCDCLASDLAPYDYRKSHGRIFFTFLPLGETHLWMKDLEGKNLLLVTVMPGRVESCL